MTVNDQPLSSSATLARPAAAGLTGRRHRAHQDHHDARAKGGRAVPADPYERLQAARAAVQALADERDAMAGRLLQPAQGGDEEALVEASVRLDALPGELHGAELDLARADVEAARATLRAAEASLARARAELEEAGAPDAARARLETDEHWVRECRLAAERAERRHDQLSARRGGPPPPRPPPAR